MGKEFEFLKREKWKSWKVDFEVTHCPSAHSPAHALSLSLSLTVLFYLKREKVKLQNSRTRNRTHIISSLMLLVISADIPQNFCRLDILFISFLKTWIWNQSFVFHLFLVPHLLSALFLVSGQRYLFWVFFLFWVLYSLLFMLDALYVWQEEF